MKIGRNDLCPCGSGKKYKKCCLNNADMLEIDFSKNYFYLKGKKAEEVLQELAQKTFLVDWCFLNPKLPDGKELCDLLVIFDDIAIIWQIKDLKLDKNGKYKKSEVEKNLRQLSGARRKMFDLKEPIILENLRRSKETFNPEKIKEIYLISVLFGEGEEVFSFVEEFKQHTIHIFNREFTELVLNELDTISDFIEYLRIKEKVINKKISLTVIGGEKELLAFYLMNNRSFDRLNNVDLVVIESGSWEGLQNKKEYKAKKLADKISYGWDNIINRAHEGGKNYEKIAQELARSNRFQRRYLTKIFLEAHIKSHNDNINDSFRRVGLGDGITYCFLFQDDFSDHREFRQATLGTLCFIARGKYQQNNKVLGIATEKKINPICSYDFCLLNMPVWTEVDQKNMEKSQKETNFLMNVETVCKHEDEYPQIS